MTTLPQPAPVEVHLFYGDPSELLEPGPAARARALLTSDEVARMERYLFERDRLTFLATRALVRTVLSLYRPIPPATWRFGAGEQGRPFVSGGGSPVPFNLSNTRGLVVCAVGSDDEVGVDVERLDRRAPMELAERFFAREEAESLRARPEDERARRFFDYWTLKESYIKARGLGLAIPLQRFAFRLEPGRTPRVTTDPQLRDDGERWRFAQRRPTADHLVAVCRGRREAGTEWEVVVRERWQRLDPG